MKCPKCGNYHPIETQHLVFYPYMSQTESDRRNYAGSRCQICGHKWNKYHSSETSTRSQDE